MEQATPLTTYSAKTIERFWSKVDKTETCWNWTGTRGHYGHGSMKIDGKNIGAHRVSYTLSVGPIPDGLVIDHICHNPSCVNPGHLRAVGQKQNMENRTGAHSNSKSGVRGVSWSKNAKKWRVDVKHNGVTVRGGVYASIDDAERAAVNLRNRLHTHNDMDRAAS